MNWFDAERQVLDRHEQAWRMAAEYDLAAEKPPAARRKLSPRRVLAVLGGHLEQVGNRLQGSHVGAPQVEATVDGRLRARK